MIRRATFALSPILAMFLALPLSCLAQATESAPARTDAPLRTAAEVLNLFKDKPLFLRGCWEDNKLEFNSAGELKAAYRPTSFTLSGFDLRDVSLNENVLQLEGDRVGLEFDDQKRPKRVALPEDKKKKKAQHVIIRIDAPFDGDFSAALQAVLADGLSEMVDNLPDYWANFANSVRAGAPATASGNHPGTSHVGGGVTEPKVLRKADPTFNNSARFLKYSGNTDIYLIIDTDGIPTHLMVAKPIGLGLDEEAIRAVSQYRFKPATKDGKPVKVDLYIDVNFQIF